MVYLRSEEHLERWLDDNDWEPGATLSASKMNELSREWWGTRLDSDWRPRPPDESQAILERIGLTGEFWQLV
ncbi:MAG: alkylmercury lyase family protein [Thermoleophilia bacterium]|nr:alkylmercury lyase family protein [Thermoleophilia bacterium]MDH4340637.1 alkylmercury lyase family protein [Thermoleophilia bacterium]MDH5282075.1 alkylmercury lyase family protein [Thermoleophilia bacterium]